MRKIIFSLIMVALVAFSCKKEKVEAPVLKLSKNTIEVSNEASEQSINVTTNQKTWEAKSNADWITVSKNSDTLKLSIKENTTNEPRKAEVTIIASTLKGIITINQSGIKPTLELVPNKLDVESVAGTYSFAVKTNVKDWIVECDSNWVKATPLKDKNEVTLNVEENKTTNVRNASILVKDPSGTTSATFTLSQKGTKQEEPEPPEQPTTTFATFPMVCTQFGCSREDIIAWESQHNGTLNEQWSSDNPNIIWFNCNEPENAVLNHVYFLKNGVLSESANYISDTSKAYKEENVFTDDFLKLLEKEGFVNISQNEGYAAYKNDKLNIIVSITYTVISGLNYDLPLIDIRYSPPTK